METEACKRLDATAVEAEGGECAEAEADNGVDNSDSDSEDLGPETAVDTDDLEAERLHDPAPPTPPAHTGMQQTNMYLLITPVFKLGIIYTYITKDT